MHYNEYTLPNGLRIIHEPTLSKVAYCGFAIDAGTRDEAEDEQGMAHFVEHLIFKGTEKRKAWHILNRMENVGGDLNAYTNKEETVVYAAFLTGHLEQLFSSGSTRLIKGFKGKKGVAFDASVTFDAGFTLTLSFPKNGNGRKRK